MQIGKNQDCRSEPNSAEASRLTPSRHHARILVWFALIAALASAVGLGQPPPSPSMGHGYPALNSPLNQPPDANQRMLMHEQQAQKRNFEAANTQRKKIIADESALLLKLATDLKTEMDKTDNDTLSLVVVRKAELIEKLAQDVKEKMRLTVGPN